MNLSPSFIITLEVIQAMRIYEAKDSKKKTFRDETRFWRFFHVEKSEKVEYDGVEKDEGVFGM